METRKEFRKLIVDEDDARERRERAANRRKVARYRDKLAERGIHRVSMNVPVRILDAVNELFPGVTRTDAFTRILDDFLANRAADYLVEEAEDLEEAAAASRELSERVTELGASFTPAQVAKLEKRAKVARTLMQTTLHPIDEAQNRTWLRSQGFTKENEEAAVAYLEELMQK